MLDYLKFLPYLGVAVLLIATLWFRGEAEKAWSERDKIQVQYAQVVEANRMQQKAIDDLRRLDQIKDQVISEYTATIDNLTASESQLRSEIRDLENANPVVRDYLNTPIPPDLMRLLNNQDRN